ncbi:MAG: ABC transporter ATP-binding protein [Actinomycetota bacterium]
MERIAARPGAGRRLVLASLRGQRRLLAVSAVITLAAAVAAGAIPALVESAVDAADDGRRDDLVATMVWFGGVSLVGALANALQRWAVSVIGQNVLHDLRVQATHRLGALPLGDFERIRRGDLVARVTGDVERLEMVATNGLPFLAQASVSAVAAFAGLLIVSPPIALLALVVVPPMLAAGRWLLRRSGDVYPRARRVNGEMIGELAETLEGADTIRTFGRGRHRLASFGAVNTRSREANLDGMRMRVRFFGATTMIYSVMTGVVVVAAAALATDGRISTGVVAAAVIGTTRVFDPVADIVSYLDPIRSAQAALDRVATIAELGDDRSGRASAGADSATPGASPGEVRFDGVSFAYRRDETVIDDVTLRLAPGTTTAIVGDTGAGKSTLARLMTGLAVPGAGTVTVAGHDVAGLAPERRRRVIATVLQEGFCIDGTIADNLRLADADATDDELAAALDRTTGRWWRSLPEGLGTATGTGGRRLSNGQRQLVALARVAVLDPQVVVLDEATSLLDPDTEATVAEATERAFAGRTVVVIAHRRSTAARADRVLHVHDGRIIADGPPSEVLHHVDLEPTS